MGVSVRMNPSRWLQELRRRSRERRARMLRESADWWDGPEGQAAIQRVWDRHVERHSHSSGYDRNSVFGVRWDGNLAERDRLRHELAAQREAADEAVRQRMVLMREVPAALRAEAEQLEAATT